MIGDGMDESKNWKTKVLLIGGTAGLLIGLVTAFLFIKNHPSDTSSRKISSSDGMKLGLGLASFIKQIAELGR
jgi:hypothetical protein